MISLLLPTRNRPQNLKRFITSARETASSPVEVVCYVDDDDTSYDDFGLSVTIVRGPRIIMSDMCNKCAEKATGDILGAMCDDTIFRTPNWDNLVEDVFNKYPDHIIYAHGADGNPVNVITETGKPFGTLGFIHRRWYDTVGYITAPYFSADMTDTWLNDVADKIDRHEFIPDFLTEHMHYAFGKGKLDKTHAERLARMQLDNPGKLYYTDEMKQKREEDADKLREVMRG